MPHDSFRGRLEQWINPQIGWIALFGLVLGLLNSGYNLIQAVRPAAPHLLVPEQVLMIPDRYPSGATYARFALRMTYLNQGPFQRRVVVLRERLRYSISGKTYVQPWQSFDSFQGRGCALTSITSEDVAPVILEGEDAASHVTYFAARSEPRATDPYLNFQLWDSLLEELSSAPALELVLQADLLDGRTLHQHCRILLTFHVRERLRQNCPVTLPCEEE